MYRLNGILIENMCWWFINVWTYRSVGERGVQSKPLGVNSLCLSSPSLSISLSLYLLLPHLFLLCFSCVSVPWILCDCILCIRLCSSVCEYINKPCVLLFTVKLDITKNGILSFWYEEISSQPSSSHSPSSSPGWLIAHTHSGSGCVLIQSLVRGGCNSHLVSTSSLASLTALATPPSLILCLSHFWCPALKPCSQFSILQTLQPSETV